MEIKINNITYLIVLYIQSEDLIELLSELLLERIKDYELQKLVDEKNKLLVILQKIEKIGIKLYEDLIELMF